MRSGVFFVAGFVIGALAAAIVAEAGIRGEARALKNDRQLVMDNFNCKIFPYWSDAHVSCTEWWKEHNIRDTK